jgi:2-polyprenyl-6-methoxyphenol hydroxylase-like FAD-dependent oxidoreductase
LGQWLAPQAMATLRTQVAIIGAGPAGLVLGQLLHLSDIDSIIVETRTREYVAERVRAGVLDQGSVDLSITAGVGERLRQEALFHDGIYLNSEGHRRHIDMCAGVSVRHDRVGYEGLAFALQAIEQRSVERIEVTLSRRLSDLGAQISDGDQARRGRFASSTMSRFD